MNIKISVHRSFLCCTLQAILTPQSASSLPPKPEQFLEKKLMDSSWLKTLTEKVEF